MKLNQLRRALGLWLAAASCSLFVAMPVWGKTVSSASELSAFQFRSQLTSGEVAGANLTDQGGFFTEAELIDPVISGVMVPGAISTDARMTPAGPATWIHVDLRLTGQFVSVALVEVVSEVIYEIAALGPAGEAQLRINARGKRRSLGNLTGSLARAQVLIQANTKLYETDAQGNRAAIANAWLPETQLATPGVTTENFSDLAVLFDEINSTFTVATNQVYQVVVTSAATINIRDISAFNLDSFGYMETSFSPVSPGIELAVSPFANSDVTQVAPPQKQTAAADGSLTAATISAGSRLVGTVDYQENFRAGDSIEIVTTLEPRSEDIGAVASIYVVVATESGLVQVTADGITSFDGSAASLLPLTQTSLRAVSQIDVTDAMGGQISLSEDSIGRYEIFVGYSTEGSSITFTEEPLVIDVGL